MMTYEQFLKQLRRIGTQLMFSSIALAVITLITVGPIDLLTWCKDIFIPSVILGLIGLCIYPQKN